MNAYYIFANTFNSECFAYIDPGTGSLVFQMLAAGILGVVVAFKNLRNWILGKIAVVFGRPRNSQDQSTFPSAPSATPSSEVSSKRL